MKEFNKKIIIGSTLLSTILVCTGFIMVYNRQSTESYNQKMKLVDTDRIKEENNSKKVDFEVMNDKKSDDEIIKEINKEVDKTLDGEEKREVVKVLKKESVNQRLESTKEILDIIQKDNTALDKQIEEAKQDLDKEKREELIKNNINPDIDLDAYEEGRKNEEKPQPRLSGMTEEEFEKYKSSQATSEEIENSSEIEENTAKIDEIIANSGGYGSGNVFIDKDLYNPTGLSENQFNLLLEDTPLSGLGNAFVDMENKWGVDGLYAMSVAFHESAKGNSSLAKNKNNLFGMKSRNGGWRSFESKYDNIMYFGEYMNKDMYKGKNIYEIGKIYCPPNTDHWVNSLDKYYVEFMEKLGG